ncbi:MAG: Trk system potassium transporter TrkA [Lachnospiraceae bacterium]|nr:Trk system potassium transporter TrkA [Lachnospiraceae bacterium]
MRIIIVGCGKVGTNLAQQLSAEHHNLVIIDEDEAPIQAVSNEVDCLGIVGNGVSHSTLKQADIEHADLLIAVTDSDEQNLLCCLIARKTSNCKTIARVRNPLYHSEIEFLKREFELAMIINPEEAAANEISRIFMFPSALKIESFAKGHVDILHFPVAAGSPLDGITVHHIRATMGCNVLICTVKRGEDVFIPNGDSVLHAGDIVGFVASRKDAIAFFKKCHLGINHIDSCMIAGGGKISFYLAKKLLQSGIDTAIVEQDLGRCEELAELLPKATIIHGDVTDQHLLEEEGLANYQGFAALTGLDEENIFLSLYVKSQTHAKVITKINRINFDTVIDRLDLDTIITPQVITADYIIKYVRTMRNVPGSAIENLYKLENGRAEALEFYLTEDSSITNVQLQDLAIRPNTLICTIFRNNKSIIPSGHDTLQKGDHVIVVTANHQTLDIKDIVEG